MAYSRLDREIIVSGLLRQTGGQTRDIIDLVLTFCELSANQQEGQIRNEATLVYNETQAGIARLQAEITSLEARAAILLARSRGNQ